MKNQAEANINTKIDETLKEDLNTVYNAMKKEGYNPVMQLSGYILSEDPIYIPTCDNARKIIKSIDRDDILKVLIENYFEKQ